MNLVGWLLGFNIPSTAKVIWRGDLDLQSHPTDWRSQRLKLRPLVYKASYITTAPPRFLISELHHERTGIFCLCEKGADQLCNNCTADHCLSFHYTDSTIPLLPRNPKFQAYIHILWLHRPVCVRTGRKPRRPVFPRRGSYTNLECVLLHMV